jgi:hypothetical protein
VIVIQRIGLGKPDVGWSSLRVPAGESWLSLKERRAGVCAPDVAGTPATADFDYLDYRPRAK